MTTCLRCLKSSILGASEYRAFGECLKGMMCAVCDRSGAPLYFSHDNKLIVKMVSVDELQLLDQLSSAYW